MSAKGLLSSFRLPSSAIVWHHHLGTRVLSCMLRQIIFSSFHFLNPTVFFSSVSEMPSSPLVLLYSFTSHLSACLGQPWLFLFPSSMELFVLCIYASFLFSAFTLSSLYPSLSLTVKSACWWCLSVCLSVFFCASLSVIGSFSSNRKSTHSRHSGVIV